MKTIGQNNVLMNQQLSTDQPHIRAMVSAKQTLEYYVATVDPSSPAGQDYLSAYRQLQQYIEQHCIHEYIYDWIDTDYETSRRIRYCKHCEKTVETG